MSCGVYNGKPVLDLDYAEDSSEAETDANFVITGSGGLVEVQGSAEGAPFSEEELIAMLGLAKKGVAELIAAQKAAVEASVSSQMAAFADRSRRLRRSPATMQGQGAGDSGDLLAPFGVGCGLGGRTWTCLNRPRPRTSFAGNARIKAHAAAQGPLDLPSLSDDSGLEVDALGGATRASTPRIGPKRLRGATFPWR